MKIGEKEFKAIITNRVIWEIEEDFDNLNIGKIMEGVENFSMKQMGILIWHGIKSDITFEDFADSVLPSQYVNAANEVALALTKSFDDGVKKK